MSGTAGLSRWGFLPTDLPNCALWFDAFDLSTISLSTNNVTQWNDKSGNGRNATQSTGSAQGVYGTRAFNSMFPGITFNTSRNMTLASATTMTQNITAFTTVAAISWGTATGIQQIILLTQTGVGNARYDFLGSPANPSFLEVASRRLDADSIAISTATTAALNNTATVVTGTKNWGAATASGWVNGVSVISGANGTAGSTSNTASSSAPEIAAVIGAVGEIIAYPYALTTIQQQAVERYLGAKWGISIP